MTNLIGVYAATFVCIWTALLLVVGVFAWIKERWFR